MTLIATKAGARARPPTPRPAGSWKGEFYRQSRIWHGYLSAFAFLALIFFALTGLLLNHPDWLAAASRPKDIERKLTLPAQALETARKAPDPSRALVAAVERETPLRGAFQSGEIVDGEAMIRLEGVTGSTDLLVDMEAGAVEATIARADAVTTLNELHRGKNAGAVWKLLIDIAAVTIFALSVVGYVLFFSLRFRLRTSLVLTAVSLGAMVGAFVLFVP